MDQLIPKLNKEHGENTAGRGLYLAQVPRLQSGIFAFDLATGGGIPKNRLTIIYGTESSNKTNTGLCLIRQHQMQWPDQTCVFVDIEGTLTTDWAAALGVDVDQLVVIRPDYAEQAADIVVEVLKADDCGLLVIDSIAALCNMAELERSAEVANVGGSSRVVGNLVRQCTSILAKAAKAEDWEAVPTIVWINQIRFNIGVKFGNPETFPGGNGQKFMAALRVRLSGKNIVDESVNKAMPVRKYAKGIIQKWKQPIFSTGFEYEMAMVPHKGLTVGYANDWPVVKAQLNAAGLMTKDKKGYHVPALAKGMSWGTQAQLWQHLRVNCMSELLEMLIEPLKVHPQNGPKD
jgi:recombination protein RecA